MAVYEIKKLILAGGICPYDEWFSTLTDEDQYMVDSRLLRLRLGLFGETNRVGGGINEIKFRKGRAIRIYFAVVGKQIILIICGGDKRTQQRDIAKAKELFSRYSALHF